MRFARRGAAVLALSVAGAAALAAPPQPPAQTQPLAGGQASVSVNPGIAKLGQRVTYRGRVTSLYDQRLKWLPPEANEAFTWGKLNPSIHRGRRGVRASARLPHVTGATPDTQYVETQLQVFRTGVITIPGLRLRIENPRPTYLRLPAVNLIVISALTPADSNADLRPLRGPMGAPWWERVPWRWVALGAVGLAAGIAAIVHLRRRKRATAPIAPPVFDPVAIALAEIVALRGRNLPAHGRFAEHAFHLTRIARCFLEAVAGTPRPGDTTPELIQHLESSSLDHADVVRIAGLLRIWDRLKFARGSSSAEEALRAERAVEAMVKHHAPPAVDQVA